ncbi:unnamed protein product [Sphagnum jensenii]|uniref:Uncharacterized protein n=1 Tax=Sphagnum jensenii TaxID=128206 RepID=A0ABP1BDE9_9BRYO
MHEHSAQNAGHMTLVQYYVGRQGATRRTSGRRTDVGRKSEESLMDVGRKSNESSIDVGRTELSRCYCNGKWRRCTTAPGNPTLLWQGQQRVAARCCGNGQ